MTGDLHVRELRAVAAELRARLAERDRMIVALSDENRVLREQVLALAEQLAELTRRLGGEPAELASAPVESGA